MKPKGVLKSMRLQDLAGTVRLRRRTLGLSQGQLAKITGLSRQTIHGLERGDLDDLGFERVNRVLSMLGVVLAMPSSHRTGNGLWMAAKSASVSYRGELSPDMLSDALLTGKIPLGFRPHLSYLLDEAPVELVIRAVEDTAARFAAKPRQLWHHVRLMAKELASSRIDLWS